MDDIFSQFGDIFGGAFGGFGGGFGQQGSTQRRGSNLRIRVSLSLEEIISGVEWVSYNHGYHGYVFPIKDNTGNYILNEIQVKAIDHVIDWLRKKLS